MLSGECHDCHSGVPCQHQGCAQCPYFIDFMIFIDFIAPAMGVHPDRWGFPPSGMLHGTWEHVGKSAGPLRSSATVACRPWYLTCDMRASRIPGSSGSACDPPPPPPHTPSPLFFLKQCITVYVAQRRRLVPGIPSTTPNTKASQL